MIVTMKVTKFERFTYRPHFAPEDIHGWGAVFEILTESGDLMSTYTVSQRDSEDPAHWWIDAQVMDNGFVRVSHGLGSRDCIKHNLHPAAEAVLTGLAQQEDTRTFDDEPHVALVELA